MSEFPPGTVPASGSDSVLIDLHRAVGRLEGKVDALHEAVVPKLIKLEDEVDGIQRFRSRVVGYWIGATAVAAAIFKLIPS